MTRGGVILAAQREEKCGGVDQIRVSEMQVSAPGRELR